MLGQLGQRHLALDGGQRHFALNAGVCVRRARLLIVSPDSRVNLARRQAETPLSVLCRFPKPALRVPAVLPKNRDLASPEYGNE
jgi:hypothetical protein